VQLGPGSSGCCGIESDRGRQEEALRRFRQLDWPARPLTTACA
jgi:hypothetical protein